jgi:DNA-binding response OmpR family regulator
MIGAAHEPMEDTRGKVLLLIGHNAKVYHQIHKTLERAGYRGELRWTETANEAMDYLFRRGDHATVPAPRPDVVLLDLHLPAMRGEEFLRRLRRVDALRSLPVVVFTESPRTVDVVRSYKAGANCYLVKPRGRRALEATVRLFLKFWLELARVPKRG